MTRHATLRLLAILGLVALVYAPVIVAPFCSYDDFYEVHRAAFMDAPNPSLVVTTSHFEGARYRPLNRGLNLVTFLAGNGAPLPFRLRNLMSHLACVVLVFALSSSLFASHRAASWTALLFGLHPLANMTVVGAVVTNAIGHGLLLAALLLFLRALRATSSAPALVGASLAVAALAILTYDAEVVFFPLTVLLVFIETRASGRKPGRSLLAAWIGGGAILAGGYGLLRALYVPAGKIHGSLPSLATLAKSAVTYGGALLLPVDPVFLHEVFGTPFPSELAAPGASGRGFTLALLGTSTAVALLLAAIVVRRIPKSDRASATPGVAFVVLGILVLLSPLLLFTKHASETYVYLPTAFVALLVGVLLDAAGRSAPRASTAAGILLVGLAAAATLSRNLAVLRCGRAAERLVDGLRAGAGETQTLLVANLPGEERSRRYGFYGFRGTDTVGDGALADSALTAAFELARHELGGTVSVLEPDDLRNAACAPAATLKPAFWVRADGSVSRCACEAAKEAR
jgi:hypothetical protein